MTKSVFDVLKKGPDTNSKKKRTSKSLPATGVEKRQKSLTNDRDESSMAHLLVVGDAPGAGSNSSKPTASVFSVLTANAAQAFQTHHFFCGIHPDGLWQTDMWTAGQARPMHTTSHKWTASVKVKLRTPLPGDGDASSMKQPAAPQEVEIKLCTTIGSDAAQALTPEGVQLKNALQHNTPPPGYERYIGSAPLLKSALQKCVRRCRPKEAAKLAFALLEQSPADALRRAAVMSVEDACLHPLVPAVVWLMMAQAKGYKLSFDHKALVVRYFHELAASHVRESADFDAVWSRSQQQAAQGTAAAAEAGCSSSMGIGSTGQAQTSPAAVLDLKSINSAVPCTHERALLSSMLLRASYGGMTCDVSLLHSACGCWLQRFNHAQQRTTAAAVSHLAGSRTVCAPEEGVKAADRDCIGTATVQALKPSPWQPLWTALYSSDQAVAIPWGGIHMLRASDIPLAAVDGHVTQGVMSALLADDAIMSGLEGLACQEGYSGDDPQQILSQVMCAPMTSISNTSFLLLWWKHRSGVSLKVLVNCSHPDCAATASRILPLQGDDILKSDDLTRRICSVADAWSRKFILRCFSL